MILRQLIGRRWFRYGVAAAEVAVASLLTVLVVPLREHSPFLLYAAAVVASAWCGGLGPALLAIALSILAAAYWILPPLNTLFTESPDDAARLGVFLAVGLLVTALAAKRRKAEREARGEQKRYRHLVESSLGLICTHDLDGKLLGVNPAAAESLGYRPGDGIGRSLQEFLAPAVRPLFGQYLERIRHNGTDSGLMVVVTRTGAERSWLYRNVLFQESGKSPYVLGHAVDVTDLRQAKQELEKSYEGLECRVVERTADLELANEQLRAEIAERQRAVQALEESERRYGVLAETVPEILFTNQPDGACDYASNRFYEYTGMPRGTALGFGWLAALHQDDAEPTRQSWAVALKGQRPFHVECRLRRADGMYRWFLANAVPIRDGEGRVTRWFGVSTDIDDQKQAEQERARLLASEQAARAEAERANRLKDQFLATVSHELRTPLTAILGWARMLRQGKLEQAVREQAVEIIERNARAQAELIEEILDVSRIVTGKVRLEALPLEVAPIVGAAVESIRPHAEDKNIRLVKNIEPVGGVMLGDPKRVEQVVSNLLSNAVKFTPAGGRVEASVKRVEGNVEIAIDDTGIGVPPDCLRRIFERFWQADSSMGRAQGGLGLGLTIARSLVHLQGGSIRAESPGENLGSTFTVTFPLTLQPGPGSGAQKKGSEADLAELARALHGLQVLLVEDEPDTRLWLAALLSEYGAKVHAVGSAPEALHELEASQPNVLISDIGLRGMDGYTLLRNIRDLEQKQGSSPVPAIALTAYAGADDRQHALEAGYQVHLAKPVDLAGLLAAIGRTARPVLEPWP